MPMGTWRVRATWRLFTSSCTPTTPISGMRSAPRFDRKTDGTMRGRGVPRPSARWPMMMKSWAPFFGMPQTSTTRKTVKRSGCVITSAQASSVAASASPSALRPILGFPPFVFSCLFAEDILLLCVCLIDSQVLGANEADF